MHFAEAVSYLLSLGHETLAIKLGLKNIAILLEQLDNPNNRYPAVQIAGTNGKGSTAVMLDAICRAAGIKTGLFTSPHLVSITERIRIAGAQISEEFFSECATSVRSAVEALMEVNAQGQTGSSGLTAPPTFFEQVTAIALLAFAEQKVELAILETGLGGRLDATTAAGAQTVGISSIGFDHEKYLGETLQQIAAEKAAIIRRGVTAVIAPQPAEVMRVISERCEATGVSAHVADTKTIIEGFTKTGNAIVTLETASAVYPKVKLGLRGRHQIENAALALRLAETLGEKGFNIRREAIVLGLEQATHAGRLELMNVVPPLLLDGAHNAAGAKALRAYFDEFVRRPLTLVFGAMRDKQLHEIGRLLFPPAARLVLTAPDNPRAAKPETLRDIAAEFLPDNRIQTTGSSVEAMKVAREITPHDELICVAGSLYLVGEIRKEALTLLG